MGSGEVQQGSGRVRECARERPGEGVLGCANSRGSASIEGQLGKTNINDLQCFLLSSPVTFWGSLQENSPMAIT